MKLFDVLSTAETYSEIAKRMVNLNRFAWTRWGDGELMYINGEGHKTDHKPNENLKKELIEAFQINDPNFMIGMGAGYEIEMGMEPGIFAPFGNNDHLIDIVNRMGVRNIYPNFILFHYLLVYQTDVFKMFFNDFIKPKKIMFVSGQPVNAVTKILGKEPESHIQPSLHNAYDQIDDIYGIIKQQCSEKSIDIILFACGMDSNVLQKRLWKDEVPVKTIDLGSVVDVFSGDMKRTWVKKKRDEILEKFK